MNNNHCIKTIRLLKTNGWNKINKNIQNVERMFGSGKVLISQSCNSEPTIFKDGLYFNAYSVYLTVSLKPVTLTGADIGFWLGGVESRCFYVEHGPDLHTSDAFFSFMLARF